MTAEAKDAFDEGVFLLRKALESAIQSEIELEATGDNGHYDIEDIPYIIEARHALEVTKNMGKRGMEYDNLSESAKESIHIMVNYCLENGIGMGMRGGFKKSSLAKRSLPKKPKKKKFRLEIEKFCRDWT